MHWNLMIEIGTESSRPHAHMYYFVDWLNAGIDTQVGSYALLFCSKKKQNKALI